MFHYLEALEQVNSENETMFLGKKYQRQAIQAAPHGNMSLETTKNILLHFSAKLILLG